MEKNTRLFKGVPLFLHAVGAGIASNLVDHVLVSTDDDEIASQAESFGADARLTGPNLHTDHTTCYEIETDAMEHLYRQYGYQPDILLRLQPTSPFRTAGHIREAYDCWSKRGAIVGVEPAPKHPTLLTEMRPDGTLEMNQSRQKPRQDYDPVYAVNGAIYMARTEYWRRQKGYFGPQTEGYVMDQISSWDLDSPSDWELAEAIVEARTSDD